jgi:hypothetical protein
MEEQKTEYKTLIQVMQDGNNKKGTQLHMPVRVTTNVHHFPGS